MIPILNNYKTLEKDWTNFYLDVFNKYIKYDKNIDFNWISTNKNITIDFIQNHPEFNWDYKYLSSNQQPPP